MRAAVLRYDAALHRRPLLVKCVTSGAVLCASDVAVQLSTLRHIIGAVFMPGVFVVCGTSATELGGLYFSSVSKLCTELSVSAGTTCLSSFRKLTELLLCRRSLTRIDPLL